MIKATKGFTFIELLIAIAIIAILVVVATGSYKSFSLKGRRADGINALLSISMAEERYRSTNTTYGTIAQAYGPTTSPQGYYTLNVSGASGTGYTATATAVGSQANDSESGSSCATLTLSVSSGTVTQSPAACWPS